MKKYSKVLLLVTLFSLLFVTGCQDKIEDLSKYSGTYEGKYTVLVGDQDNKDEDDVFSLELKEDGTGKHNRNGASYNVTWELDGENFKMSETFIGDPIIYTGTLKDGQLKLYNGDQNNSFTYIYYYEKK
jgi:hypothetical protein